MILGWRIEQFAHAFVTIIDSEHFVTVDAMHAPSSLDPPSMRCMDDEKGIDIPSATPRMRCCDCAHPPVEFRITCALVSAAEVVPADCLACKCAVHDSRIMVCNRSEVSVFFYARPRPQVKWLYVKFNW